MNARTLGLASIAIVVAARYSTAQSSTWQSSTAQSAPQAATSGTNVVTHTTDTAESDTSTIVRWREALEIDDARAVVEEARALFTSSSQSSTTSTSTLVTNGAAIAIVARARFETGDEDGALALLRDAKPTATTRAKVELARARLAIERDELKLALSILRADGAKETARFPDESECWLLLGRARVRAGDARAATEPLLRFVKDAPLDIEAPMAWHMLTQAALERGDANAAERFRQSAEKSGAWQSFYRTRRQQIRAAPDEPLPRLGLAELWLSVDENAKAKSVLDDLVRRAPQFARGHARLGDVCVRLGDARAARTEFDRAIELDAMLAEARMSRAELALVEKRVDDARSDLEWIVASPRATEPRFVSAHLRLARIWKGAGDADQADRHYARYRELGGTEAL